MKHLGRRLIVTLILLYGLGAVAYGLLHYPPGERPDVWGILSDFTGDLGGIFRRKEPARVVLPELDSTAPGALGQPLPGRSTASALDRLRGDHSLSLGLAQIQIPDSGRLPAAAAEMWDTLRPIHAEVLPEVIAELSRLRTLASTDKLAIERDRSTARARLATARKTLLPHTQEQPPYAAAAKLLEILERVDAELAAL